jgi:hypothetical protein
MNQLQDKLDRFYDSDAGLVVTVAAWVVALALAWLAFD